MGADDAGCTCVTDMTASDLCAPTGCMALLHFFHNFFIVATTFFLYIFFLLHGLQFTI